MLKIPDKIRKARHRRMLPRGAGMAAGGFGSQPDIRLSFFKNADHGEIPVDAAHGIGDNAAALIADQERVNPPALQLVHQLRAPIAGPFLRAGGGKINIVFRHKAFGQHLFRRLKKRHDAAFRVGSAAAPDLPFRDVPGKGRMLPFAFRGNHILVAHQHQRPVRVLSAPEEQQISVDLRLFQPFMHKGKKLPKQRVKAQKLLPLIRLRNADRLAGDHPAQEAGVFLRPAVRGRRLIFRLFLRNRQGPDRGDRQQNQNQPGQDQNPDA